LSIRLLSTFKVVENGVLWAYMVNHEAKMKGSNLGNNIQWAILQLRPTIIWLAFSVECIDEHVPKCKPNSAVGTINQMNGYLRNTGLGSNVTSQDRKEASIEKMKKTWTCSPNAFPGVLVLLQLLPTVITILSVSQCLVVHGFLAGTNHG